MVNRPRERASGGRGPQRIAGRDESQRRFIAVAAHEIRTPLTSLHLMLSLLDESLRRPDPDLEDVREQVARALKQSARVAALCRQLLDLSRLDAGVPLQRTVVELGDAARSVIAEFAGAPAVFSGPADAPAVWAIADPDAVAQVLRILLENGLRFALPGTPVRVSVGHAGDHVFVVVADHGLPIRDEDRERIFERFERGSDEVSGSGAGLGLAIGRDLARRMGGDLWLGTESWTTRFLFDLPTVTDVPDERSTA